MKPLNQIQSLSKRRKLTHIRHKNDLQAGKRRAYISFKASKQFAEMGIIEPAVRESIKSGIKSLQRLWHLPFEPEEKIEIGRDGDDFIKDVMTIRVKCRVAHPVYESFNNGERIRIA